MANFSDYPCWGLLNGRLLFSLSAVTDGNLQATATNPATGAVESCVTLTFDVSEERAGAVAVRTVNYFGDDAIALRAWMPGICTKIIKP